MSLIPWILLTSFTASIAFATTPTPRELDSAAVWAIYTENTSNRLGWNKTTPYSTWNGVTVNPVTGRVTELDIHYCMIFDLPAEIGLLESLTRLNLSENHLWELPKEIGNLSSLVDLNLSDNVLHTLPIEIGNLSSLIALGLSRNNLTTIPNEIGNLKSLTRLGASNNKLTEIPVGIGALTALTSLNFENNKITDIPKEIGNLTSLDELLLGANQIQVIPIEIGNIQSLTRLNLSSNSIRDIPVEIGKLQALNHLGLGHNLLDYLPAELGNLTSLTTLYLENNQLETVIGELSKLKYLQDFNVYFNYLTKSEKDALTAIFPFFTNQDQRLHTLLQLVSIEAKNKVYDGTSSAQVSWLFLSGNGSTDDVTVTCESRFASSDVGTGIGVTSQCSMFGKSIYKYDLVQPNSELKANIVKAPLKITVSDVQMDPGSALPSFVFSYSGFASKDDASVVSGLSANANCGLCSIVGVYDIIPTGAAANNYSISYGNGKLTLGTPLGVRKLKGKPQFRSDLQAFDMLGRRANEIASH